MLPVNVPAQLDEAVAVGVVRDESVNESRFVRIAEYSDRIADRIIDPSAKRWAASFACGSLAFLTLGIWLYRGSDGWRDAVGGISMGFGFVCGVLMYFCYIGAQ